MPQENCREAVFADYIWNQDMMTNSFNCTYCYKYYYPILDERNKTLCMQDNCDGKINHKLNSFGKCTLFGS